MDLKKNCLVRFNCHSIDPGKCISLKPPGDGWKMSFRRSATGSRYEDIRRLTIESEINTNHATQFKNLEDNHQGSSSVLVLKTHSRNFNQRNLSVNGSSQPSVVSRIVNPAMVHPWGVAHCMANFDTLRLFYPNILMIVAG